MTLKKIMISNQLITKTLIIKQREQKEVSTWQTLLFQDQKETESK